MKLKWNWNEIANNTEINRNATEVKLKWNWNEFETKWKWNWN